VKLACYKGTRPGLRGLFNVAVRWWLSGQYSHCEIVFSDGVCGSSSWMDGGVRLKVIDLDPARWDTFEINGDEHAARRWFEEHAGQPYDLLGLLGFVWRRGTHQRSKWTCGEAAAASLGKPEPFRYDPCIITHIVA
jgi:hypothetical protein